MANLKLELKTKGKNAFTAAEIKPFWAAKNAFADYNDRRQTDEIWKALRDMVKDRELAAKAVKADAKITGLPSSADDYPGTHKMDVFVDGERACRLDVDIEQPKEGKKAVDAGFSRVGSAEDAAKLLANLKKNDEFFKKNLTLKKGDSQHPDNILWKIGSVENSLPMNAHTKGPGGKNEKVALDKLKKTMKALGYT